MATHKIILEELCISLIYTSNTQMSWKNEWDEGIFFNTWSLAVEEQYYILRSLIVPFSLKLSSRNKAIALMVVLSSSFLLFITTSAYRTFVFNSYISLPSNVYKVLIGLYLSHLLFIGQQVPL
jgi:peptidoglycan/LPS O-acetylase OafA/YrhL